MKIPIENYIRQLADDSTFPHVTFIRVGFFYQSILTFFLPNAPTPEFRYPGFLSARIPLCDVRDIGKVVYECFSHPERFSRDQVIPIVAEQLTIEEICTIIQAKTDKDVKFVPLTSDEALRKLHRYIVNVMRWHHDFGSIDEQQVQKTKEIYPNMNTFAAWFQEIARSMGW